MTNDPSAPSGLSLAAIAALLKGQTIEAIKVVRPRAEPRSERSQGCRRGLSEDSTGPEEKKWQWRKRSRSRAASGGLLWL
jgi:hypothetical protein